jgi:hypothetical protein
MTSKATILEEVALAHGYTIDYDPNAPTNRAWKWARPGMYLIEARLGGNLKRAAKKLGLEKQYEAALFAFKLK